MAWKNFDYDVAFQSLIDLVEMKLAKATTDREHDFEWLQKYPVKAKEMLERPTEEFKMPKTPARKKRGQQKKRGLTYDEDHLNDHASTVPSKKGKLSNEEDELRESIGSGRPRRQASSAAKSKIQQSLKINLKQKLRRPSGEEESSNMSVSVHESDVKNQVIEEECLTPPVPNKSQAAKKIGNETITVPTADLGSPIAVDVTYTSVEENAVSQSKVKFAPESKSRFYGSCEAELSIQECKSPPPVLAKDVPVEVPSENTELPKRTRNNRKPKKEESAVEQEKDSEPIVRKGKKIEKKPVDELTIELETHHSVAAVVQGEARTRLTRQSVIEKKDEEEKIPEKDTRKEEEEAVVKKNRKVRKPAEEKPVEEVKIVEPSPIKEDQIITVAEQVVSDEEIPVVAPAPSDLTVLVEEKAQEGEKETKEEVIIESDNLQKKKVRKPRKAVEEKPVSTMLTKSPRPSRHAKVPEPVVAVVSSPRRATRVTAPSVSAAQNSPIRRNVIEPMCKNFQSPTASSPVRKMFTPKLVFSPFKPSSVKTKVEAFEAALNAPGPAAVASNSKGVQSVLPEARVLLRRLTREELKDAGVKSSPVPPKERKSKRGTFVTTASSVEKKSPTDKSVAQVLARKSVEKAKNVAITAARTKLINSVVQNETTESPSVHLNRNASAIMSKYRFTNTSGSSGSSSANLNRHVAMTQAKTLSNVVTGVSSFTGKPAMVPLVTKSSEDDEAKRKDHELKRLKEKEAEAARKREELIKAKAEEQKKKHEARAKRAMEQRALRAQQIDQEQKQKLENKEEKSANIKMKILAENQEKAEKVRAALLYRQQEAEQRRKAEELEKQRLWEEEQQRQQLAAKKEQEEKDKLAKLKQAEAEKSKTATAAVPESSSSATAGSSKLNTTVTLLSQSQMANNYQITPVRVTKMGKVVNPDNYDIGDMRSDDSTDDDSRPKKVIPSWARSASLKLALAEQARGQVDTDLLFPAEDLLQDPNLNKIFNIKRARFDKRTSSAVWKTPPAHYM